MGENKRYLKGTNAEYEKQKSQTHDDRGIRVNEGGNKHNNLT